MTVPEHEVSGDNPQDFVNPIDNPDLPWITAPTFDDPVPEHRLGDEPETVEVED